VISTKNPDTWTLIMGALFIGVVLLFPTGIVGLLRNGFQPALARFQKRTGMPSVADSEANRDVESRPQPVELT
jgi:urea transport system permease protein